MRTIRIGRGPNNDVVINDGVVSTSHAVIVVSDFGEVSIEDLNSMNGTYVDGKRVSKAVLKSTSTVHLGNHSIDWKQIIQKPAAPPVKKRDVMLPPDVVESKLIGRNLASQIRFSYEDVSDKHAYLCKRKNGEIVLVDNNSTNGTYVNGSKIVGSYTLKKGDNVAISNRHPLNWETVFPMGTSIPWKPLSAVAVAVILVVVAYFVWPFGKDWSDIYAEHKNDVVLVRVHRAYAITIHGRPISEFLNGNTKLDYCYLDEKGELTPGVTGGWGTAFFISKDGKMLTNRHVVQGSGDVKKEAEKIHKEFYALLSTTNLAKLANNLEVESVILSVDIALNDTYINSEKDLKPCRVLKVSEKPELDVAVLQTNNKALPTGATFVDLSKSTEAEDLKLGYGVCTIGFPQSLNIGNTAVGLEANNQSGEITQERGEYVYGHNMMIHQGASGSPVYDKKGRFAGIIVSGFLGLQGFNQAIHPEPVLEFVGKSY